MKQKSKGFTLIELMITIAILSIIAAFAIPAYQDQVRKGRRADAVVAANEAAQALERCFTSNDAYSTAAGCGTVTVPNNTESPEGFYVVNLNPAPTTSTYTIVITPLAGGPQAQDIRCARFTLDNLGQKRAFDSTNAPNNDECWRK